MPSKTEKTSNLQKLYAVLTGAPTGDAYKYHAYRLVKAPVEGQAGEETVKVAKTKRTISGAPAMFAALAKKDESEAESLVYIASLRLYCHPDVLELLLDKNNAFTGKLMTKELRNAIRESQITDQNVNTDEVIVTGLNLVEKSQQIDYIRNGIQRMPVRAYLESLKKPRELFKFHTVLAHIASLSANVNRKMFLNVTEADTATKTRKVCVNPVECVQALLASDRYAEISNMLTTVRPVGGKPTRVWTGITGKKKTDGGRHVSSLEVFPGVFVSSCVTKEGVNVEKRTRVINAIALYQAWIETKPDKAFNADLSSKQLLKATKLFEEKLSEHEANKKANQKATTGTGKKGKAGKKATAAAVPRAKSSPQKVTRPVAEDDTDEDDSAVVSPKKSPSPVTARNVATPMADDSTDEDESDDEVGESPKPVTPEGNRLAQLNRARSGKTGGGK